MSRYRASSETPSWVTSWLFLVMVLVIIMIVFGGATRLTNSGLSITEWLPIRGAVPPLSNAQWLAEFDKYKNIPEFLAEHPDMDLKGFKFIYFMEWGHRQLGRLIGLVYALPFFWLLLRRQLPKGRGLGLFAILLLIGLQGGIGWWMVYSGLQEGQVSVSPYRLATHLGMAFIILGCLFWLWRDSVEEWPSKTFKVSFKTRTSVLVGLIYLQIFSGAFVAGTQAGKSYNSWPLMDGSFIPEGYLILSPFWKNMFENIAAIQFNHRILAYAILLLTVLVIISTHNRHRQVHEASKSLLKIVFVQIGLGIWTLLSGATLILALLHQFMAVFVVLAGVGLARAARVQIR